MEQKLRWVAPTFRTEHSDGPESARKALQREVPAPFAEHCVRLVVPTAEHWCRAPPTCGALLHPDWSTKGACDGRTEQEALAAKAEQVMRVAGGASSNVEQICSWSFSAEQRWLATCAEHSVAGATIEHNEPGGAPGGMTDV